MNIDEWIKLANQNREVDFYYEGNKYSVSVSQSGRWFLTKYNDCESEQEFNSFLSLIYKSNINGINFVDICTEFDIDAIY